MFGKKYCIYDLWWWICLTNNPVDILIRPFGKGITLVAADKCFELIWRRNGEGAERISNCTLKGCDCLLPLLAIPSKLQVRVKLVLHSAGDPVSHQRYSQTDIMEGSS